MLADFCSSLECYRMKSDSFPMKSSSASSEGTFYYQSVTLLSMKMNDRTKQRSVLLYSLIERGSQHKVQEQTPKALQGCPSPLGRQGAGHGTFNRTEQIPLCPFPSIQLLPPGNASSLLTPPSSRDESRDISDVIA